VQGYLFSRPLPLREIERLFLSEHGKRKTDDGIVAA
jgi:hypothetical protein